MFAWCLKVEMCINDNNKAAILFWKHIKTGYGLQYKCNSAVAEKVTKFLMDVSTEFFWSQNLQIVTIQDLKRQSNHITTVQNVNN